MTRIVHSIPDVATTNFYSNAITLTIEFSILPHIPSMEFAFFISSVHLGDTFAIHCYSKIPFLLSHYEQPISGYIRC